MKYEEEIIRYSKLLETVLGGIPDIIGVYEPNNTILFYNKAGYDFYKTNLKEVHGKKCYEMLGRTHRCGHCNTEEAIRTKQMICNEKFIPELNKYMDSCCNPVLDDDGEVILLIEQLKDITEKKVLENILKETATNYEEIVNHSPDAIIIIVDGVIVLANTGASELLKITHDEIIGKQMNTRVLPEFVKPLKIRMKQLIKEGNVKTSYDYKILRSDNIILDVEATSNIFLYQGKPAIQSVIRDITDLKRSLNKAASIQRLSLPTLFPIENKVNMETLFIPAKTVSGDFFYLHKVNEDLVVGIMADVNGKGISAALHISAFDVLFHEAVLVNADPFAILNELNIKIGNYLEENYIAACCFSLDFKNMKAKVVGAGINEFVFQKKNEKSLIETVKGSFLGMFQDSIFDEKIISFEPGDKFYFYTDGLDFIFNDEKIKEEHVENCFINETKKYLDNLITKMLCDIHGIKDDCTLLTIEIKQ